MICYESENRRAEVQGCIVTFIKMTGDVRRSKVPVFCNKYRGVRKAKRLALRWVEQGLLGREVL